MGLHICYIFFIGQTTIFINYIICINIYNDKLI